MSLSRGIKICPNSPLQSRLALLNSSIYVYDTQYVEITVVIKHPSRVENTREDGKIHCLTLVFYPRLGLYYIVSIQVHSMACGSLRRRHAQRRNGRKAVFTFLYIERLVPLAEYPTIPRPRCPSAQWPPSWSWTSSYSAKASPRPGRICFSVRGDCAPTNRGSRERSQSPTKTSRTHPTKTRQNFLRHKLKVTIVRRDST